MLIITNYCYHNNNINGHINNSYLINLYTLKSFQLLIKEPQFHVNLSDCLSFFNLLLIWPIKLLNFF